MTRATPAEVQAMEQFVATLPDHRRVAVVKWVFDSVGNCAHCDEPIRRIDPRRLDDRGRLVHLGCRSVVA